MSRRQVILAAGALALAALAGGSLYLYTAYQRSPVRLALGQGAGTPLATTSAEPTSAGNPCTPAAGSAGSVWVIEPGSQVGYRAREKFGELESPHEAVARTNDVTGFVVIQNASSASTMSSGCVAADVRTLVSVDQLPPPLPDATGRDQHYGEMLDTGHHPYVVFRPEPIQLPSTLASGGTASVGLVGQLEIRGEARRVTGHADAMMTGREVQVAGSFAIRSTDFGVEMPNSFPMVDTNLTLEFLVRLTAAAPA